MELSQDTKLFLHLDPPHQQLPRPINLESFLSSTPRRDTRLRLGLAIVHSVLNLGPDWIPDTLSKNTVVVLRTEEASGVSASCQPYIFYASIHAALQKNALKSQESAKKARSSLLALGILLLELLFRETLEQQSFRVEYLSNGQPNEFTDLCTALRWQKKVEGEFGDKLASAIWSCVQCEFDSPNLERLAFVHAVLAMIVKPIEEFLQAYS
jgi:hypothetical protein